MTLITIPNRPAGTDVRSIEQILADFDAITSVVNGNLDVTNLAASLKGLLVVASVSGPVTLSIFQDTPFLGGGPNDNYNPISGAPTYSTGCVAVWAQTRWYSDSGHTTLVSNGGGWISYRPSGATVIASYYTASALYPISEVFCWGY